MVGKAVLDVKPGDRFFNIVSKGEPNAVPGQKPGSRYFSRVVSVKKDRWYVHFTCEIENSRKEPIGQTHVRSYKRGERCLILEPKVISDV